MAHLTNIAPAPWNEAAVEAANQETGIQMSYRNTAISLDEMDQVDAAEAYDNGYRPGNMCSIWSPLGFSESSSAWFEAFDRHCERLKTEAEKCEA